MEKLQRLSDEIIEKARDYCSGYKKVSPNSIDKVISDSLNLDRAEYQLASIINDLNLELDNKHKILEIGSGLGSFLMAARKRGIDCCGIEPSEKGIETAVERMPELEDRIKIGAGENLPYENNTFDLVVSFQVLEHTRKPEKVLQEAIRVLKSGGFLYFVIPNYNSFWEGHYGLYWLPQFPRPLAKLYLKILGRETAFLDGIQYITPRMIVTMLSNEDVEILSLGLETWQKRLDSLDFATWGHTRKLLILARLVHKLRILSLIKYLGEKFEFYFPIILIAKKK